MLIKNVISWTRDNGVLFRDSDTKLFGSNANEERVASVHSGLVCFVLLIVVGWFGSFRTCCRIASHLK